MSTGLSITQAVYGAGSTTVDVTKTVSAMVRDGVLSFTVSPTTLNVTDPAPGQLKTLNLSYSINGGSKNSVTKKDNDSVYVNAPPAKTASGLQIIEAEYGYAGNFTDVTSAIQNLMSSSGSINMTVGFKQVGIPDPNPNKQKELRVKYSINGAPPTSDTLKDGQTFQISAPAVQGVSSTTPSQNVASLMNIIFKSVAYFFGMFLYTFSVFVAIEYGNQFISPMLWGALAFFMPFFSFWGLPVITFGVRLFRDNDIIH